MQMDNFMGDSSFHKLLGDRFRDSQQGIELSETALETRKKS
jgi:hypothetical protein